MAVEQSLRDFLAKCGNNWGPQDLRSVQRKLRVVGINDVRSLLKAVREENLNLKLEAFGERTFTSQTLAVFRVECDKIETPSSDPPGRAKQSVDEVLAGARQRARSQEATGV